MQKKKHSLFFSLKLLVSITFFLWLLSKISLEEISQKLDTLNSHLLALGFLLLFVCTFLAAFRWQILLIALNCPIKLVNTWVISMIGTAFDQTFFSTSGDVYRGWRAAKRFDSLSIATTSILLDRMIGMSGLIAIIVFGLPFLLQLNFSSALFVFAVVACISVACLAFLFCSSITLLKFSPWLGKKLTLISDLSSLARQVLKSKRILCYTMIVTITLHWLIVLCISTILTALQVKISLLDMLIVVPPAIFITLLPISIGGWGVREGTLVYGLGLLGIAFEDAFLASLLFGFGTAILGMGGWLLWLFSDEK